MPVSVRYEGTVEPWLSCEEVCRRAERMLRAMAMSERELSVLLCDDPTIQRLNREYRQLDQPTDVLAFSMNEGEPMIGDEQLLGDVVISLAAAARQAEAAGHRPLDEVTLLLGHGLLHLLGFDHRTKAEERRMRARTDLLCAAAEA